VKQRRVLFKVVERIKIKHDTYILFDIIPKK